MWVQRFRERPGEMIDSIIVCCVSACLSVCMITSQLSSCLLFFSLQYVRMHSPQSSLPSQALLWRKRGVKSSPMQCKSWRRKTALWRWLVVSAQRIIFIYILDTESRGYIGLGCGTVNKTLNHSITIILTPHTDKHVEMIKIWQNVFVLFFFFQINAGVF